MDNACNGSRGRIAATSRHDDGRLTITIEDDGPGLPGELQGYAPAPGARFDEKVHGTGLVLVIVRDLATLYCGSMKLGSSGLGGLRAELTLPAVSNGLPAGLETPRGGEARHPRGCL